MNRLWTTLTQASTRGAPRLAAVHSDPRSASGGQSLPSLLTAVDAASQQRPQNWTIALLLSLFLGLVITYAALIPPLEGFDALAH